MPLTIEKDHDRLDRLDDVLRLLKPFMDYIRAEERKRCMKIVRSYSPWDTPPIGVKEVNARAELITHCGRISSEIEQSA